MEKKVDQFEVENVLANCCQQVTILRHAVKSMSEDFAENSGDENLLVELVDFLIATSGILDSISDEILSVKGRVAVLREGGAA